jgi:hypothetical protein
MISPIQRPPNAVRLDSPPKESRKDPVVQAPAKGNPLEIKKVTAVPAVGISKQRTKAAAPQAPADQLEGTKVPPRKDETQVSTSMVTRSRKKASGAGGLRGVDGLGQTAVARASMGPHSKT